MFGTESHLISSIDIQMAEISPVSEVPIPMGRLFSGLNKVFGTTRNNKVFGITATTKDDLKAILYYCVRFSIGGE